MGPMRRWKFGGAATSITYKAQDLRSDDEMALEVISPGNFSPEKFEEIEKEAGRAQELSHINLPKLHAFGRESDHLLYATEYFDGTSAEDWVKTHGPMPVGPVLRIAIQIVNTLGRGDVSRPRARGDQPAEHPACARANGRRATGRWSSFWVCSARRRALPARNLPTRKREFAAQFASPEQSQNGAVDFRSEMYSLGATLWFLLTGAAARGRITGRERICRNRFRTLLDQMLARDPEQRPHDPVQFEERIRTCLEQAQRREAIVARRGGRHRARSRRGC